MSQRVAIAISGGVDSTTAALLLKKKGYEVIGVTGFMHSGSNVEADIKRAKDACKIIGVEHKVVDLKKEFNEKVIKYFEESYRQGLTPNPCTHCNKVIKWDILRKYSHESLKTDYYATGHYARISKTDNSYKLFRAKDLKKDQSYMLFTLDQDDLAHTVFPLGNFTKPEIRKIALENNIPSAEKKDSQDVCFIIPPDTTKKYLTRKFGNTEGNIIDIKTGKILGRHDGSYKFTIGQRKGIGIAASEPLYVISTNPKTNTVYVGFKEDLYSQELTAVNVNWQQENYKNNEFKALVKIRYNSEAKPAIVIPQDNNSALVKFDNPLSAITPGQVAAFYDLNNEFLIGGGWIQ